MEHHAQAGTGPVSAQGSGIVLHDVVKVQKEEMGGAQLLG
jgi:hypothetical protein